MTLNEKQTVVVGLILAVVWVAWEAFWALLSAWVFWYVYTNAGQGWTIALAVGASIVHVILKVRRDM